MVVTGALVKFVVLRRVLEEAGALWAKSITCVPGGAVNLTFAFFRRSNSTSPVLRFEGLAPRMNVVRRRQRTKLQTHE